MLIYWGCSPTVAKGQPEVIDFRNMSGLVPPEVAAMARQSRTRKGGGSAESLPPRTLWWPHGDDGFKGIPEDASAVGDHAVKASFMQRDITYTLDKEMDFLEPMNLKANSSDLKAAIPLEWDKLCARQGIQPQRRWCDGRQGSDDLDGRQKQESHAPRQPEHLHHSERHFREGARRHGHGRSRRADQRLRLSAAETRREKTLDLERQGAGVSFR